MGSEPTITDVSDALVLFENNSAAYSGTEFQIEGGTIDNWGFLFIGEEATGFSFEKAWDDRDDITGVRPDNAAFLSGLRLFADGEPYELGTVSWLEERRDETGTVLQVYRSEADHNVLFLVRQIGDNTVSVTVDGLPKFIDGKETAYTLDEDILNYAAEVSGDAVSGFQLVNRYSGTGFSVQVIWDDIADAGKIRPNPEAYLKTLKVSNGKRDIDLGGFILEETRTEDRVVHYLFRSTENPYYTVKLTDGRDNLYTLEIGGLPAEPGDEPGNYEVTQDLPAYETEISGSMAEGYVIRNSFTPVQSMEFFRLLEESGKLPQTGL